MRHVTTAVFGSISSTVLADCILTRRLAVYVCLRGNVDHKDLITSVSGSCLKKTIKISIELTPLTDSGVDFPATRSFVIADSVIGVGKVLVSVRAEVERGLVHVVTRAVGGTVGKRGRERLRTAIDETADLYEDVTELTVVEENVTELDKGVPEDSRSGEDSGKKR